MTPAEAILAMVQARFAERGRQAGRVSGDRVVVALDPGNRTQLWVTAPVEHDLLSVQIRTTRRAPRDQWPAVLRTVNDWNRRRHTTAAFLAIDDWEIDSAGGIVIGAALPLAPNSDIRPVMEFVDAVVADAKQFWKGAD